MKAKSFTPRPYQRIAVDHILDEPRCAVWAGMGTGKTASVLTALDILRLAGEDWPALAIGPLRVARDTWTDEAAKWEHLKDMKVVPVLGSHTQRANALKQKADLYTINYENLPWLVNHLNGDWPFRTTIADESTRLRGFRTRQGSKQAGALGTVAYRKIERFIELTGTPDTNGLADLWGQAWFLDAGVRLGRSYSAFTNRWFKTVQVGNHYLARQLVPHDHAQVQIQTALRDLCLSIDGADYFDLETPVHNVIEVDLPPGARAMYRQMEKEFLIEIEGEMVEAANAAVKSGKLLQLANGAVYTDDSTGPDRPWAPVHDAKLEALDSIVTEAAGAPVLVAYHFRSDLARLRERFKDGAILSEQKDLKAFKAGQRRIGFAHPDSLGHGVDGLQEHCHIIAFYGHGWSLEKRLQMIERIGPVRQFQAGHKRPVFIHDIIARGTVDEDVMLRHTTKRGVLEILLESMKRRAG